MERSLVNRGQLFAADPESHSRGNLREPSFPCILAKVTASFPDPPLMKRRWRSSRPILRQTSLQVKEPQRHALTEFSAGMTGGFEIVRCGYHCHHSEGPAAALRRNEALDI